MFAFLIISLETLKRREGSVSQSKCNITWQCYTWWCLEIVTDPNHQSLTSGVVVSILSTYSIGSQFESLPRDQLSRSDFRQSLQNWPRPAQLTCLTYVSDTAPVTVAVRSEAWVLASWLLGAWVRIPLKAWMFVGVFLCCVVLCR
jgi:hypothetical protein